MGQTFADLLAQLIRIRDGGFRSNPERTEAMISVLTETMQTLLEKLRDRFDR